MIWEVVPTELGNTAGADADMVPPELGNTAGADTGIVPTELGNTAGVCVITETVLVGV